ncbi:hypothetical protein LP420_06830 [Massilia sp. B-10]|nr:hypothetical protein LP420_06830 [Massilia sp. B-10]
MLATSIETLEAMGQAAYVRVLERHAIDTEAGQAGTPVQGRAAGPAGERAAGADGACGMSALYLLCQALFIVALALLMLPISVFVLEVALSLVARRRADGPASAERRAWRCWCLGPQ